MGISLATYWAYLSASLDSASTMQVEVHWIRPSGTICTTSTGELVADHLFGRPLIFRLRGCTPSMGEWKVAVRTRLPTKDATSKDSVFVELGRRSFFVYE